MEVSTAAVRQRSGLLKSSVLFSKTELSEQGDHSVSVDTSCSFYALFFFVDVNCVTLRAFACRSGASAVCVCVCVCVRAPVAVRVSVGACEFVHVRVGFARAPCHRREARRTRA